MAWIGTGIRIINLGETLQETPPNGCFLFVAGKVVSKSGELENSFSHRRPTIFWYETEELAEEALKQLGQQEDKPQHPKKREISLGGVAAAWIERRHW